jgi:hypothetical protein
LGLGPSLRWSYRSELHKNREILGLLTWEWSLIPFCSWEQGECKALKIHIFSRCFPLGLG